MINAIVTDIEGTTSSLSFVKDVLFPYARSHIGAFVRRHQHQADVTVLLEDVRKEVGWELDLETIIAQLIEWIDNDQKVTPLKSLQGLIWRDGYEQGAYRGHVYVDVPVALQRWKQQGINLYVYSSGSVYAQKLLFSHTEFGDLTPLFSGYFDTHVGAKQDKDSYRTIAECIARPARQLLFLSDVVKELDAATQAGFHTCQLVREESGSFEGEIRHRRVRSFSEIEMTDFTDES